MNLDKSIRFTALESESGSLLTQENTRTVDVPEGEIWYFELVAIDEIDGSNPEPNISASVITDAETLRSDNLDNAGRNINQTDASSTLTVGFYAYGGDTIAVGATTPDGDCKILASIRRVA